MSELAIPKDRIGRIDELLLHCIDPTFHSTNRFNHGYAAGVIDTLDLLYDEKHPKLNVNAYAEELTADSNLGHEALRLIEEYLKESAGNAASTAVHERMEKIVEAWLTNTWTKAHMPVLTEKKVASVTLRLPDGQVEVVHGPGELFSIAHVEKATSDYGHMFFRRLGIIMHGEHAWLYAEFCNEKGDEPSRTRIGELTGDIATFNLPVLA